MGDNEKLLPCPFCGEVPKLDWAVLKKDKHWWVMCCNSEACPVRPSVQARPDEDAAIAAWNTRPTAATVSGEGLVERAHMKAALKETLKRYPNSEDALVFFSAASGLAMENPTEADKAWASTVVAALSPPTEGK